MYYPYFIAYVSLGLLIGIAVFLWALKNGQFKDQERARYLPLDDADVKPAGPASGAGRLQTCALLGFLALGLLLVALVLVYAI